MHSGGVFRIALVFVLLLLNSLTGCGSSEPKALSTAPVKGTVTYKGKPLTKGSITFEPDGSGREAHGEIQPDGSFVLTTYKKDDGAVIGTHRVAIVNAMPKVPVKYASASGSKIEIEVAEGKTDYTINLQ